MLLSLLATVALFLTSNALSLDSSVHLARHQHVAARHPAIKRSVSARCQKRNSTSPGATSSAPPATHTASPTSSSHTPPQSSSPSSGSSGSSGSSKRGISWSNQESDSPSKNFVTDGMSLFVDFLLYSSSYPYLFFPAHTIGMLSNQRNLLDCNIFQCYGAIPVSIPLTTLSSPVMQLMFSRSTSESMAPFFFRY